MCSNVEAKPVNLGHYKPVMKYRCFYWPLHGFTLMDLLVVISIISVLMGILLPVLGKVRQQPKTLMGVNNQRQIVLAANCFAMDNGGQYPRSVATLMEDSGVWHWQEPTMMAAISSNPEISPMHRSMSAYLRSYITDTSSLFSPSAPEKYKYLQEAWDAGDDWDNPDTPSPIDLVCGTYCFYWNYTGFLGDGKRPFRGPRNSTGGRGQSKLLVSDYFGFGHWRNMNAYGDIEAYGSCVKFRGAGVTPGTELSSAFWSRLASGGNTNLGALKIKLHAGYVDGRVGSYYPSEVVPMEVSFTPDGGTAYPSWYSTNPGIFYLPREGLR